MSCCQTYTRLRPRHAGEEEGELRELYKEEFAADEDMQSLADCNPPARRTKAQAIASGNRVLAGEASKQEEAFHDVDLHSTQLWYHDKIRHTLYDLAHEFANVVKHMFNWMKDTTSKDQKRFTTALRTFEIQVMERFPALKPQEPAPGQRKRMYPTPPWVASKGSQANVDSLPAVCKVPMGWPDYRKMFGDLGHAKTSESILFAGDVGAYTLRYCDIDPKIRALFIKVLRLIQRYPAIVCFILLSDVYAIIRYRSCNRMYVRHATCLTVGAHSRSVHLGIARTPGNICPWSWLSSRS